MNWTKLDINGFECSWERIWEWSLVLLAIGIEHKISEKSHVPYIEVEEENLHKAVQEILQYEKEKEAEKTPKTTYKNSYSLESSFWILSSILLFHIIVINSPIPFITYGSFYSFAIYKGEIWRFVTSLFLHKDISHLFSNLFWEVVFLYFLLKRIPPGFCWLMILLSGILGNILNYLVQPINHVSIGFSTCVFGSIGLGIGINLPQDIKGTFIFFMAGLSFFAMLGVGGPNIDVLNHLFGLFSGFVLGIIFRAKLSKIKTINEIIFYFISFLIVTISWVLALNFGYHYDLNLS